MATTPNYALPYPLPSAPVANGAADIQALATQLDSTALPGLAAAIAGAVDPTELTAALAAYIAKAIVDVKGDLIVATGPDAVARIGTGVDGQVLTADSAAAVGVRWATAAGGGGGAPGIGTSLPGSPADGTEYVLVDSLTAPTYAWTFRYVAGIADANKWVYVGGYGAYADVATAENGTSTAYGALTTPGPSFTIPRAGVYDIEHGFGGASVSGALQIFMSYDIGGTAAVDADSAARENAAANNIGSAARVQRKTLGAVALVSKYRVNAGTGGFRQRYLRVTPVRVA